MNINKRIDPNKLKGGIRIKVPNGVKSLDILSLTLNQLDEYPSDNADFGVVVGRVASKGVGIPNVRVGVFIPLDEEDAQNPKIRAIYPFTSPTDTDANGNRYNLLPKFRSSGFDNSYIDSEDPEEQGFGQNRYGVGYRPPTPIGTFPSKEEVSLDDTIAYIKNKYYRYTTVTNDSGDFCLMGVPLGNQTLHVDADLTDIGKFSYKPLLLSKVLGYPENLFNDNGTKIKENVTLEDAPHISTTQRSINVKPFWGNDNSEVGITTQTITLNADIRPSTVVFHSGMTMPKDSYYYDYVGFRVLVGPFDTGLIPLPIPIVALDITSNPCDINGGDKSLDPFVFQIKLSGIGLRDAFRLNLDPEDFNGEDTDKFDLARHRYGTIQNDILDYRIPSQPVLLQQGEYATIYERGSIAHLIPCNTRKIITDADGTERVVPDNYGEGVFTEFRGSIISNMEGEIDNPPTKISTARVFMKIPQNTLYEDSPKDWVDQYRTFEAGKYYSVCQRWYARKPSGTPDCSKGSNSGMLRNIDNKGANIRDKERFENFRLDYFDNDECDGSVNGFRNFMDRNVHFCLYYLQYGYKTKGRNRITCGEIVGEDNVKFNANPLGGGLLNTQHLARGDNFKTDFIEVPKRDILLLLNNCRRSDYTQDLKGRYYGVNDTIGTDIPDRRDNILFFKGLKKSDCLYHLYKNGLL